MAKVLIVDDDPDLICTVAEWLKLDNYSVDKAVTGEAAIQLFAADNCYDLVILDMSLPDFSGIEICQNFRSAGNNTPILFLTGNNSIDSKENGFEAGGDDYLTKPFNLRELTVRVRALLRRAPAKDAPILKYQDLSLDSANFAFAKGDKQILLQPREFALLEFFMRHPEQTFDHSSLISQIWSSSTSDVSADASATLASLRKKLDPSDAESYIKTVETVGYKLHRPNNF